MSDKEETQTESTEVTAQQPQAMQVNIKMQQGEHTGQPIYSNITAVQSGPGVVIVDFGFLDPQTINALNRKAKSGEKTQTVNARMSCRMAISVETANQLARQLNQLIQSKTGTQPQAEQQNEAEAKDKEEVASSGVETSEKGGIRFPWSSGEKKNH